MFAAGSFFFKSSGFIAACCDIELLVNKVAEFAVRKRRQEENIIEAQLKEIGIRGTVVVFRFKVR
jgi:hypothetical protein